MHHLMICMVVSTLQSARWFRLKRRAVSATGNGNARASPPPPSAAKQVETKREWAKVAQTKPPQPAAGGAAQAAEKDGTKGSATVAVAVKTDNASPRVGPAPVTANAADSAKLVCHLVWEPVALSSRY